MFNGGQSFDVILMSFVLDSSDGLDGPKAASRMRENGFHGILLGVTSNTSDHAIFKANGADDVVEKPLNLFKLWSALKGVHLALASLAL